MINIICILINPFISNFCPVDDNIFILEQPTSIKAPVFHHMVKIFSLRVTLTQTQKKVPDVPPSHLTYESV